MITIQRMVPDTENRTFIQFHKLFTFSFYLHVFLLQNRLKKTKGYLSTNWGWLTFLFLQQGHINAITAITNTYKCLVCDTLYSKQCVYVCINLNNNPIRCVLLLSQFYRCGNWGAKRVTFQSHIPLGSGRVEIWIQQSVFLITRLYGPLA